MKKVLLSADGEISVYSVPDEVADNLERYCLEFCTNWLCNSPDATRYRVKMGNQTALSYSEKDFIDYLNQYICDTRSVLIETLAGVYCTYEIPKQYTGMPYFNF